MKNNGIQWLRAIAALEVALWHSDLVTKHFSAHPIQESAYAPFGGIGVELFFVISGYIMCLSAPRYRSGTQWAVARVLRLFPLYWFYTGMVMLAGLLNERWRQLSLSFEPEVILASLFMLPQQDYPILSVGWSLEHEMIFYALIWAVLVVCRSLGGRVAAILGLVLLALGATGTLTGVSYSPDIWDYHFFSPYMLAFGAGWLLRLCEQGTPPARHLVVPVLFAVLLALALAAAGPMEHSLVLRIMLATGIFLAFQRARSWLERPNPLNQLMARLGDASYSLYLCHWFLLSIAGKALGRMQPPEWTAAPFRLLAISGCVAASLALYAWIEQPLHDYLKRRLQPKTAPATA